MTFEQWAHAIGEVESGHDPHAWGDSGLACGRYQIHPAFFIRWCRGYQVAVGMSWDRIFYLTLQNFWNHYQGEADKVKLAMAFHLGEHAVFDRGEWDAAYEARFRHYCP